MPTFEMRMLIPSMLDEDVAFLVEKARETGWPILTVRYEDVPLQDAQERRDALNAELASRGIETFPPFKYVRRTREAARR